MVGLGPKASRPKGTMGLSCINFSPSRKELDLEFGRCPLGSKINLTASSRSSGSSYSFENSFDLLFQIDFRHCFSWCPELDWMCTKPNWCFKSWIRTICTWSSNFNGQHPRTKSIWGTSMIGSSFMTSWSLAFASDNSIDSSRSRFMMRPIKWSNS